MPSAAVMSSAPSSQLPDMVSSTMGVTGKTIKPNRKQKPKSSNDTIKSDSKYVTQQAAEAAKLCARKAATLVPCFYAKLGQATSPPPPELLHFLVARRDAAGHLCFYKTKNVSEIESHRYHGDYIFGPFPNIEQVDQCRSQLVETDKTMQYQDHIHGAVEAERQHTRFIQREDAIDEANEDFDQSRELEEIAKLEETKERDHEEYMQMEFERAKRSVESAYKNPDSLLLEDSDPDDIEIKRTDDDLISIESAPSDNSPLP